MDEGLQIGLLYPGDVGTGFLELAAIKGSEAPHGVGIGGDGVIGPATAEKVIFESGQDLLPAIGRMGFQRIFFRKLTYRVFFQPLGSFLPHFALENSFQHA